MRRLASISLLLLLLFNLYGYRVVLACLQTGNETALERQLDKKAYRDEELISIKTKLDLPYYTASPAYERAYGSVSIGGHDYEYVKRRIYRDTLELLCLPNPTKTDLKKAGNDYAQTSADGQASTPVKKGNVLVKIGLPDFCQALPTAVLLKFTGGPFEYYLQNIEAASLACTRPQDRPPKTCLTLS